MELPKWNDYVKTSTDNELAPYNPDWYYIRAASVARKIYLRQGVGVGGLRKYYGRRSGNQTTQEHFHRASGGLIRHIFHALESMKVLEKMGKGGRKITDNGQRDLDRIARKCATSSN